MKTVLKRLANFARRWLMPRKKKKGSNVLVLADFQNGVYELNGSVSSLQALFEYDPDWSDYDHSSVVPGVGLTTETNGWGPKVVDAVAADFLSNGVTIVAEMVLASDSPNLLNASFAAEMVDLPDFAQQFIASVSASGNYGVETPSANDFAQSAGNGLHKVALNIGPNGIASSVDGGAVKSLSWSGVFLPNALCFSIAHGTIKYLKFYEPQPDATLPTL